MSQQQSQTCITSAPTQAQTHDKRHPSTQYKHAHTFPCPVDYWANIYNFVLSKFILTLPYTHSLLSPCFSILLSYFLFFLASIVATTFRKKKKKSIKNKKKKKKKKKKNTVQVRGNEIIRLQGDKHATISQPVFHFNPNYPTFRRCSASDCVVYLLTRQY